jgi:prevent-host-death family protein
MKNRIMSATEFKAKCLSVLDEVERSGNTVTVNKRGRPVATVQRAPKVHDLRDPADRAIVATARVHRLRLITADRRIIDSKLVTVIA